MAEDWNWVGQIIGQNIAIAVEGVFQSSMPDAKERRRHALLQAAATLVAAPQHADEGGNVCSYSVKAAVHTALQILLEVEGYENEI